MFKYTLTADEDNEFHSDEFRAKLRLDLSGRYPDGVEIYSPAGDILDTIASVSDDVGLAVPVMTIEEQEENELKSALERAEIAHVENDIKPKVIAKITADVRDEFRRQLREKTNALLTERAESTKRQLVFSTANRALTAENEALKTALDAASAKIESLAKELADANTQNLSLIDQLTAPPAAPAAPESPPDSVTEVR